MALYQDPIGEEAIGYLQLKSANKSDLKVQGCNLLDTKPLPSLIGLKKGWWPSKLY